MRFEISMVEKCLLCGNKHGKYTSDLTTNFVYMECPTCGKYILHDKSRYLYNSMAMTTVKDNIKAREFLFYHKKDQLTYFLGSQEEYKDFKLTFPRDDARLVTQQQIENWYPYKLSQIFDFAIQYFNAQQEYFGQRMQYSLYQLRSIYFIDANNVQLEDEIKAPFSEQIFYITNCLNEMGLITSSSMVSAVGHCPWSKCLSIILTPKGIEKATQLQNSQNRDVFVAMSFHKSADDIRKAIKQGIEDAQYSSLLMDEIVHNHQIVPEMLRLIKETRFMIMDITQPNFGAYYEAGYAQGLGKEVIITCSKEVWDKKDFSCDLDKDCRYKEIASKPHFDIAQKQVLVWKDYKDLTKQLAEWIKHIIG